MKFIRINTSKCSIHNQNTIEKSHMNDFQTNNIFRPFFFSASLKHSILNSSLLSLFTVYLWKFLKF